MTKDKLRLRIGDVVLHERRKYFVVVPPDKWGCITIRDTWHDLCLGTKVDECKLLMRREKVKEWWKLLPVHKRSR